MRDNPLHVQAFGEDPQRRGTALARMFEVVLNQYVRKGTVLGAFESDTLVAVCAMIRPGRCQATPVEKLRILPALLAGSGLRSTIRVAQWGSRWSRYDPSEVHWHLGPVAVDLPMQGKGIGTALLRQFSAQMDAEQSVAYLETDKAENVPFYNRFRFDVASQDEVLGVNNWFMIRSPQSDAG
jgi:ribosomal protein S18 acetylase RimI-like enzyme